MQNRTIVTGIMWAFVLGSCAFPFLRLSEDIFLAGLDKNILVGPYKVHTNIGLREDRVSGKMGGFGYFTYSEKEISKDGCLLKVTVKIEGYNEPNATIISAGNLSCLSSARNCTYKEGDSGRLSINFYSAPIVSQNYIFSLHSADGQMNELCEGTKILNHKIRYRRSSWWERAMSV